LTTEPETEKICQFEKAAMSEQVSLLMLQFLSWVSARHRTYDEAIEAWRSTCPRHTIWEDAFIEGFVEVKNGGPPEQCAVILSPRGKAILEAHSLTHSRT
jgi:hypothetical protein